MEIENINPNVYRKSEDRKSSIADYDDSVNDPFDEREIFGMAQHITAQIFLSTFKIIMNFVDFNSFFV